MMEDIEKKENKLILPEIIFIALISAFNVVFDLGASAFLKNVLLVPHIIAGIFIMVPINFIFIFLIKSMVNKFGAITLYMTIFGNANT